MVSNGAISGTLKYVSGYTGFSGDASEQSGHYLCIHAEAEENSTIKVELLGGLHGEQTLDEDGLLIARITDPEHQSLKYTATKGGDTEVRYYSLHDLVLEPQS